MHAERLDRDLQVADLPSDSRQIGGQKQRGDARAEACPDHDDDRLVDGEDADIDHRHRDDRHHGGALRHHGKRRADDEGRDVGRRGEAQEVAHRLHFLERRGSRLDELEAEEEEPEAEQGAEEVAKARGLVDVEVVGDPGHPEQEQNGVGDVDRRQKDQDRGADIGPDHHRRDPGHVGQAGGDDADRDEGDRTAALGERARKQAEERSADRVACRPLDQAAEPRPRELLEVARDELDADEEEAKAGENVDEDFHPSPGR